MLFKEFCGAKKAVYQQTRPIHPVKYELICELRFTNQDEYHNIVADICSYLKDGVIKENECH